MLYYITLRLVYTCNFSIYNNNIYIYIENELIITTINRIENQDLFFLLLCKKKNGWFFFISIKLVQPVDHFKLIKKHLFSQRSKFEQHRERERERPSRLYRSIFFHNYQISITQYKFFFSLNKMNLLNNIYERNKNDLKQISDGFVQ